MITTQVEPSAKPEPSKRVGRFSVDDRMVRSNQEALSRFFADYKVVPVRAEHLWSEGRFDYMAIGDCFDEIPEGSTVPEYRLIVSRNDDGEVIKITAEKV